MEAVANMLEEGEKATSVTGAECPFSFLALIVFLFMFQR
jgi:hypothetical protein